MKYKIIVQGIDGDKVVREESLEIGCVEMEYLLGSIWYSGYDPNDPERLLSETMARAMGMVPVA